MIYNTTFSSRSQTCPRIVTREKWNARPSRSSSLLRYRPAPWVIIHQTKGWPCITSMSCEQQMRKIQKYNMKTLKAKDILYNFCIGDNGVVYTGRGWDVSCQHTNKYYKSRSIGIYFLGRFSSSFSRPSRDAIRAARALIACGVKRKFTSKSYKVAAHRQIFASSCPGDALYKIIKTWSAHPKP